MVYRAYRHPKWHLQKMYHSVALADLPKPNKSQFQKASFECFTVRNESLVTSLTKVKDLLVAEARIRHPNTPVTHLTSNWQY
jgi:Sec7-like guanine-nucleotide exchange factor